MKYHLLSRSDLQAIDALKEYFGGAKKISETIEKMRKYETRKRILKEKGYGEMIEDAERLVKKFNLIILLIVNKNRKIILKIIVK